MVARIRANLRKSECWNKTRDIPEKASSSKTGDEIRLDEDRFCAWLGTEQIFLTPSEFKLLREFLANPGRVLTREVLMDRLWSVDEAFVDDNTLSVYIRRLRQKIHMETKEGHIQTVRGVGYIWK